MNKYRTNKGIKIEKVTIFSLLEKGREDKVNKRLVVAMILCGMLMQFLPLLIKLGIFFLLFIYLFTTWDEYKYQCSVKERRVQNVQK